MIEYVERNKLKETFDKADPDVCESDMDGHSDWGFGRETVLDVISSVPAANVAPVVYGRWQPVRESEMSGWQPELAGYDPIGGYICSACKEEAVYDCNDNFVLSNYCPNCGAKMRQEDF